MGDRESRSALLSELGRLHAQVDAEASALAEVHGARLHCARGCSGCCVDGLTVFEIEAEAILQAHGRLLREATPAPPGECAFLDTEGACRIYEQRPYVCRTQGLPLRWIETDDQGQAFELRDICPLNEAGEPIETLSGERCWTLGPVEGRLAELQRRWGRERMTRRALRSLWNEHGG